MTNLPPATDKPCAECPWRKDSKPKHLGPHTADRWARAIHGEGAIACHMTIKDTLNGEGSWDHPKIKQCAGAAQMRTNVFKSPRDPAVATAEEFDDSVVFSNTSDFCKHHTGLPEDVDIYYGILDYGNVQIAAMSILYRNGIRTMHDLHRFLTKAEKDVTAPMLRDFRNMGVKRAESVEAAYENWKANG